jgi:hydroxymethylpyrimidine pyrophosphatase-like HAD family hydrolase
MDPAMIELAALDLDGTLLRPDGTLSPYARRAVCDAAACGVEIVIASGRSYHSLPRELLSLGAVRYAITSNGAAVNRVPDGTRVFSMTLPEAAVHDALALVPGGIVIEGFYHGVPHCDARYVKDPIAFGCSPAYVPYVQSTRTPEPDIRAFLLSHAGELDSLNIVCPDPGRRASLQALLSGALESVLFTSSAPHLLEIVHARAGKGAGLRALCRMLGISRMHTAAFGNADNDADMLAFAGLGIAVSDASPACLAAADEICDSCELDGAAAVLRRIADAKSAR